MRLAEAEFLFGQGHWAGAYYLAGYAVECGLKACIAKKVQRHDFPEKGAVDKAYSHALGQLATVADLDPASGTTDQFQAYWNTVKDWKESDRYDPDISEQQASSLLIAMRDPNDGVMQMATRALVDYEIEAAGELLRALDRKSFPVSTAFWQYEPDAEAWYLYLASRLVAKRDLSELYSRIREVLRATHSRVPFSSIKLVDPGRSEVVRSVARRVQPSSLEGC